MNHELTIPSITPLETKSSYKHHSLFDWLKIPESILSFW